MRALILVPDVEIRVVKMCEVLERAGWEVVVATDKWTMTTWNGRLSALPRVQVVVVSDRRLPTQLLWNPLRSRLVKALMRQRFDVIVARDMFMAAVALRMREEWARSAAAPHFVVDIADDYVAVLEAARSLLRRVYGAVVRPRVVEKAVLSAADEVLFVAGAAVGHREERHQLSLWQKASVVPNSPMAPSCITKRSRRRGAERRVLYVGTIDRGIRDFDVVVAADEHLQSALHIDCYTFAPSGNAYVRELAQQSGRCKRVKLVFHEAVPASEYARLLSEYDVGIIPHHKNEITDFTIPNKLYDYVDAGMAVVASDNPAMVSEMNRLGAGVCYRGGDPKSFAEAIEAAVASDAGMGALADRPSAGALYFGEVFGSVVRRWRGQGDL